MKNAKLRGNPCVEDIDYRAARGLDKSVIRALTQESGWVKNHENIFVLGPTGVGKRFSARQLSFLTGRYIYGYRVRMCTMRLTRKSTMKMKRTDFGDLSCGKSHKSEPKGTRYQRDRRKTSV